MANTTTRQMYYCGNWKTCRDYEAGDVVRYGGVLWMAITQNAGIEPDEGAGYWMPFGESLPPVTSHNELDDIQGGAAGEYYHITKGQNSAMGRANNPSGENPFLTVADMPALEKRVAAFKLAEKPEGIDTLYAAAFGGGVFAAVGDDSVATSTDGRHWVKRESPAGFWRGAAYGGNVFAAVGLNGKAMFSEDGGETWTAGTAPDGDWNGLAFGNGLFVGVSDGKTMRSLDGKTEWNERDVPEGYGEAVCFGNGVFCAIGPRGVMTSADGLNWTERETPTATWRCGAYGNGKFMALAGKCMTSTDGGETWEVSNLPSGGWDAVCHGGGFFVAVGNSAQRIVTGDGTLEWEQSTAPNFVWRGLAFGNDIFVAVGGGIMAANVVDAAAALAGANSPSGENAFATLADIGDMRDALAQMSEKLNEYETRLQEIQASLVIEGEA